MNNIYNPKIKDQNLYIENYKTLLHYWKKLKIKKLETFCIYEWDFMKIATVPKYI
jgi:hypothetical protein